MKNETIARPKYALNSLIDLRATNSQAGRRRIIEDLMKLCQVTDHQVYRYCNYRSDSDSQIPSDKMVIIARYFGVTVNELHNG